MFSLKKGNASLLELISLQIQLITFHPFIFTFISFVWIFQKEEEKEERKKKKKSDQTILPDWKLWLCLQIIEKYRKVDEEYICTTRYRIYGCFV